MGGWQYSALRFAAALAVTSFTCGAALAQGVQSDRFEGILSVVWGDPQPGAAGGETRFTLTLPDGSRRRLAFNPAQQNAAIGYFGQRVVVDGRTTPGARGIATVAVDRLVGVSAEIPVVKPKATRRVLYILLKYRDDAQEPHPASFFNDLTNPLTPPSGSKLLATLNGFYNKESWGKLQWRGEVVGQGGFNPTHWLTLPKTKTGYALCGRNQVCADLNAIGTDGMALAVNAGVDVTVYDNINFVLNNDLDCCAWGGGFVYNGKSYGATWEPPWGQEAGVYVHEFGHSIGLPHSGWTYYGYDSPWDEMSARSPARSVHCATYFSANDNRNQPVFCTEPGAGYITAHKDYLGWIPAANKLVINTARTVTVTLEPDALPLGTGLKMIQICLKDQPCTGHAAHFISVEVRTAVAKFENGLPGDGVIIHDVRHNRAPIGNHDPCFVNSTSGWAVPLDARPGDWRGAPICEPGGLTWPNYALGNAEFKVGGVYHNAALHVTVRVESKHGRNYVVRVTRSQ
jgi:hypothetical protein